MPKIVSRNVVSQSADQAEETDPNKVLTTHYCLCGEFSLVLEGPMQALARRPVDGAYALRNVAGKGKGKERKVYKLNSVGSGDINKRDGVLIMRGKEFEMQRPLHCPRCMLQVGYETTPGEGTKGPVTFILPGAVSDVQNRVPEDAFGPASAAVEGEVAPTAE